MAAAEREVTPDIEREIYKSQQRTEALKRYRDEREKERKVVEEKLSEVRESQLRLRDELEIANREVQEIEQRLDATITAAGNWEKGYETTLVRLKQEMHASLAAIDSPNFEPAFSVVDQNVLETAREFAEGSHTSPERHFPAGNLGHLGSLTDPVGERSLLATSTLADKRCETHAHSNSGSETRLQPESTVAFDPDGPVTQPHDTPGLVSGQAASCSDHPPPENRLSKTGRKEVDFDEVFQSGQAEEKYAIVEFPKASREWYILRCDEHNMRFGLNPISGAAKHINGDKHGHKKKEHKTAIKMLGIQVINCDAEKVERNNAVFQAEKSRDRLAMQQQGDGIASKRKGVMPRRRSGVSRRGSENPTEDNEWAAYDTYNWPGWRLEPDDDEPGNSDGGSGSLKAATAGPITNPVVGEVYQAFWPPTNEWFAAVLLTIGDFGDLGIDGSIATTGLVKDVPDCYEYDKLEKHIFGFKPGYRDGEPRVAKRWFPCMYLEERLPSPLDATFGMRAILRADVLAWVPSQYLKPFVAQDTNITGRQLAAEWRERMKSLEGEGKNDSSNANTGTSKATSVDSAATATDDETNNKVLVIDHPTGRLHNGEESGHSNENVNLVSSSEGGQSIISPSFSSNADFGVISMGDQATRSSQDATHPPQCLEPNANSTLGNGPETDRGMATQAATSTWTSPEDRIPTNGGRKSVQPIAAPDRGTPGGTSKKYRAKRTHGSPHMPRASAKRIKSNAGTGLAPSTLGATHAELVHQTTQNRYSPNGFDARDGFDPSRQLSQGGGEAEGSERNDVVGSHTAGSYVGLQSDSRLPPLDNGEALRSSNSSAAQQIHPTSAPELPSQTDRSEKRADRAQISSSYTLMTQSNSVGEDIGRPTNKFTTGQQLVKSPHPNQSAALLGSSQRRGVSHASPKRPRSSALLVPTSSSDDELRLPNRSGQEADTTELRQPPSNLLGGAYSFSGGVNGITTLPGACDSSPILRPGFSPAMEDVSCPVYIKMEPIG